MSTVYKKDNQFIILVVMLLVCLVGIASMKKIGEYVERHNMYYQSQIDLPQKTDKSVTKESSTQIEAENVEWINSEYYYQALNEKGVSRHIVDTALPTQYQWVSNEKDVLTAWEDWGYFAEEFAIKGTWNGIKGDIKKQAARMLAESYYLQWLSNKYKISVERQKMAMNKGSQDYIRGKK